MCVFYYSILVILLIFAFLYFYKFNENFSTSVGSGYFCGSDKCKNMTLKNCLACSDCVWCMNNNNNPSGVISQCMPKTDDVYQICDNVYANDMWTRSVLSNDNNYLKYQNQPIFE